MTSVLHGLDDVPAEHVLIVGLDLTDDDPRVRRLLEARPSARVVSFTDRSTSTFESAPKSLLGGLSAARAMECGAVVATSAARKLAVFALAVRSERAFVLKGDRLDPLEARNLAAERDGILKARHLVERTREILTYREIPVAYRTRFCVVSCERHAGDAAERCLDSVFGQDYPADLVEHLYVDDASEDDTRARVRTWLAQHPGHRVTYVENEIRLGGTRNTFDAFRAAPFGVVVVELNGDDTLPDPGVFAWLDRVYTDPEVWMTYNSCIFTDGRPRFENRPYPNSVVAANAFREAPWHAGALRTFRSELFTHVRDDEMIDPETGEPWESADDQVIFLALLELSGRHSRHVERTTYVYNLRDSSEVVKDYEGSHARAFRIRRLPKHVPLTHLTPVLKSPHERVTVLLPVYNAARYVEEAARSILSQSYENLELLIVDDGSTDGSEQTVDRLEREDPRVRVVRQPNRGLVAALTAGLSHARGELIARMDADDRAAPNRIARQVALLRAHPGYLAVGSWVRHIDSDGRPIDHVWQTPTSPDAIRWMLTFESCLPHGSVTMRRAAVERAGGYRIEAEHAEDYDLWLRLSRLGDLANVPEPLVELRIHGQRIGVRHDAAQLAQGARLAHTWIQDALGRDVDSEVARELFDLHRRRPPTRPSDVADLLLLLMHTALGDHRIPVSDERFIRLDVVRKLMVLSRMALTSQPSAAWRIAVLANETAPRGTFERLVRRTLSSKSPGSSSL